MSTPAKPALITDAGPRRSTRGNARALLLDAAEELFARRGVDGVPLREIAAAAGQRNNAAVHYHFGDKQGLVDALIVDRMQKVEAARHALVDAAENLGALGIEALLRMLWRPVLDLGQAKSVHWFIQFQLSYRLRHPGGAPAVQTQSELYPASQRIHEALYAQFPELPPGQFHYRMNLAAMMFWSAVSWHDGAALSANQNWSTRFSLDEVVTVAAAALKAPSAVAS